MLLKAESLQSKVTFHYSLAVFFNQLSNKQLKKKKKDKRHLYSLHVLKVHKQYLWSRLMKVIMSFCLVERSPPELRDVFMLYCDLTPGTTVKDLCTRHNSPHSLRVDER